VGTQVIQRVFMWPGIPHRKTNQFGGGSGLQALHHAATGTSNPAE